MNALQYVEQVKKLDTLINNKLNELENLKALALKVSTNTDGERVSGGGVTDPDAIAMSVASIIEKEQELDSLIDYYINKRATILKNVEQVNDPVLVSILYARHFKGDSWERIAVDSNYTYRHTLRLHDEAITELQKVLNMSQNVTSKPVKV